jgi:hypothetical protein
MGDFYFVLIRNPMKKHDFYDGMVLIGISAIIRARIFVLKRM